MTVQSEAAKNFAAFLLARGEGIKIQNQTASFDDSDYDVATYAASGNLLSVTGLAISLGRDDLAYLPDGISQEAHRKMYLPSGTEINEGAEIVFQAGSCVERAETRHDRKLEGLDLWKVLIVKRLEV